MRFLGQNFIRKFLVWKEHFQGHQIGGGVRSRNPPRILKRGVQPPDFERTCCFIAYIGPFLIVLRRNSKK